MLTEQSCSLIKHMIQDDGWRLIDVRTAAEFHHGHLPGAEHWDLRDISRLDSNGKYFLYCRTGARSGTAEKFLKMKDVDAINIGGYDVLSKCLGKE